MTTYYEWTEFAYDKLWSVPSSPELPTLPDSAQSSLKLNQSFHVLMNKFENLPDYGNFSSILLTVFLNVLFSKFYKCKRQEI